MVDHKIAFRPKKGFVINLHFHSLSCPWEKTMWGSPWESFHLVDRTWRLASTWQSSSCHSGRRPTRPLWSSARRPCTRCSPVIDYLDYLDYLDKHSVVVFTSPPTGSLYSSVRSEFFWTSTCEHLHHQSRRHHPQYSCIHPHPCHHNCHHHHWSRPQFPSTICFVEKH